MQEHVTPRLDALLRDAGMRIDANDAAVLLMHALGQSRSWLYAHGDESIGVAAAQRFADLLSRREAGEPVAFIIGRRGFWRFELQVGPDTLIPRPETELLVELALARVPQDQASCIADLGTGSGAIALALAHERPLAQVVATDASAGALAIARRNAVALQIDNIEFREGDWLMPLAGRRFELISSNPPYIEDGDAHLDQGDLRFEPRSALVSGADGLDAIRTIVTGAPAHLRDGGWLLLEHGWTQAAAVGALMLDAGFIDIVTERDLEDRDRVTLGRVGPGCNPAGRHAQASEM